MWQWLNLDVTKQPPITIYSELSMPLYLCLTLSQETSRFLLKQNYQNPVEPVIMMHNVKYYIGYQGNILGTLKFFFSILLLD